MKPSVISLHKFRQERIDYLEDQLRRSDNKLMEYMETCREQEVNVQMQEDYITHMVEQTEDIVMEMQKEIDDLKKLVYDLEVELEIQE